MKPINKLLLLLAISLLTTTICRAQTTATNKQINNQHDLAAGRKTIDSLDSALIQTIGQREEIVKEIGIYKAKKHIAPLQAARFQQVLDKGIAAGKTQGLSPEFITKLLNAIHDESLRIERDSTIVQPTK
jgi:chorismate mutase